MSDGDIFGLHGDALDGDDILGAPPAWPDPEPEGASPFAVAAASVGGLAGIRALRGAWLRRRDRAEDEGATGPLAAPVALAPEGGGTTRLERLEGDRAALVALCVELDDLLGSPALRERLRRGLRRVGVETVEPEGARFDPEAHCAVGSEATRDATRDRTVARVERAGFRDRGAEIRPPEVTVYRLEAGRAHG